MTIRVPKNSQNRAVVGKASAVSIPTAICAMSNIFRVKRVVRSHVVAINYFVKVFYLVCCFCESKNQELYCQKTNNALHGQLT